MMASSSTRGFSDRNQGRGGRGDRGSRGNRGGRGARGVRNSNRSQQQGSSIIRWPQESPLLVVDLEATCWDTDPPPGQYKEIIEIGWALLDLKPDPPVTVKAGTMLVKPTRSTVSPFCTELTTITSELLQTEGVSLDEAFKRLVTELGSDKLAWGR